MKSMRRHDIGSQRYSQSAVGTAIVQAERLAAIDQMIDGFAHELNNPLTAIIGAIDLLDTPNESSK